MAKIKLNLGSGIGLLKGFINVDIIEYEAILKGWQTKKGVCAGAVIEEGSIYKKANLLELPFEDNYADYGFMSEVMEHMPIRLLPMAMKEICRVMKPKSKLIITTPDFNGCARLWVDTIASQVGKIKNFDDYIQQAQVIYGNQAHDGEYHRCPMTPDYVNLILTMAGFSNVKIFMWPARSKPHKQYDGMRWAKGAILRNDTIVAEAIK